MPLLDHCANTLEEMTLIVPLPKQIPTTDGGVSTHTSLSHDSIDMLPSLPNTRRICWGRVPTLLGERAKSYFVWAIAAKQLCSLTSPWKIAEVKFRMPSLEDLEKAKDHITTIDKVLTGDNFPSLSRVQLPESISFDNFPILKSRGLLESFK